MKRAPGLAQPIHPQVRSREAEPGLPHIVSLNDGGE